MDITYFAPIQILVLQVMSSLALHISLRRQVEYSPARLSLFRRPHVSDGFIKTIKFDEADDTDYEQMEE